MSAPTHPVLKPRACEVCQKTDGILRCSGCQVVYYCGQDRPVSDRNSHKKSCTAVKKAKKYLDYEEQTLRNLPADGFIPPNIFETGVGHFWGYQDTRPYMRARLQFVETLIKDLGQAGGRVAAVEAALEHLLDMLHLSRRDNMGLRDLFPPLYIRLGRDQDGYDFLKWFATAFQNDDLDWGDISVPYLDIKNADVFESPKNMWTNKNWLNLSHAVAVTLIKVRILLDLQAAQNASRAFRNTIPPEIIDLIRSQLVGSIVKSRPGIVIGDTDKTAQLAEMIKSQVRVLYETIEQYNPHFWESLLYDPVSAMEARPEAYSFGSWEESCLVVDYYFAAWAETPGALGLIEALIETG